MADEISTPEKISRKAAKAAGLRRYFTGTPCKHGHITQRAVWGGNCLACQQDWQHRNMAKTVARVKAYRKINPEKVKLYPSNNNLEGRRAWRVANIDQIKEYQKVWRPSNRQRLRVINRNREARKRENGGIHTVDDISDILKSQRRKCAYCRIKIKGKYHVDHIRPVSKGGGNGRQNLQILCVTCNLRKNAKDPADYARSLGMLI